MPFVIGFCLPLLLLAATGFAQVITPAPRNFVLDGAIAEWRALPPSVELRRYGGQRDAIWLAQTRDGLVVAGHSDDTGFKFAATDAELPTRGRVEIGLSVNDPPELPEIKYSEEDCAQGVEQDKVACLAWIKEQTSYRERLEKQFTRVWQLTPEVAAEVYALPAYDSLTDSQRLALEFVRPSALPRLKFRTEDDGTNSFEILIPWELFPPADRLTLERIRFEAAITIGGPTGISTVGPEPRRGDYDLPIVTLLPPVVSHITRCGQPLLGRTLAGRNVPALYFLTSSLAVDRVFFFENPESPYRDPLPSKTEVSPAASSQVFFDQRLAAGEYLCGPFMSYRKDAVIRHFPFLLRPPGDQQSTNLQMPFPLKRLADGTRLIRYGPDESRGPLWRKAFIVFSMRIYALTPALEVIEALSLGVRSDNIEGYGIELSDDWRTVTEFRQTDGPWTSESFCLTGYTYRSCGKNPNSSPPKQPLLAPNQ